MTAIASSKFRLRMLGGLWIEADGAAWPGLTSQRKTLALLALLARAGHRGLSREKIFGFLWPESDTESARNALSQLVFRARRELGADIIVGNGELRIDLERFGSDVADFEASIARGAYDVATGIYGGPFLDGFYIREAPEYERWVTDERQRLDRIFLDALETLATDATRAGKNRDAVDWWRRRSEAEPLSARPAKAYVEVLIAAGERETAIRFARTYAALVRSEIGAEPDREIIRLVERVQATAPLPSESPVPAVTPTVKHGEDRPASSSTVPPPHATPAGNTAKSIRRPAIAIGVLLLAMSLAVAAFARRDRAASNLVLVAPFVNETGDRTLDVLGQALASGVTQGLAATGALQVINFEHVLQTIPTRTRATGKDIPFLEIARRSGVGLLVHGTYRRRGDSLIVDSEIMRGNGTIVGSLEPVIAGMGQEDSLLAEVQDRVTGGIMAQRSDGRAKWTSTSSTLPRYSAQLAYAQGLDALVDEDLDRAIECFLKSARMDTSFSAPKIRVLQLDPPDSVWSSTRALLDDRRTRLSVAEQLELDAAIARRNGDLERYYRLTKQLASNTPDEPEMQLDLAYAAVITRRYRAAIQAVHRMADHGGWVNDLGPRWWRDFEAHHMLGDFEGALREWRAARRLHPDDFFICEKGASQLGALGRSRDVIALAAECGSLPSAPGNQTYALMDGGRELLLHGFAEAGREVLRRALEQQVSIAAQTKGGGNRANVYFDLGDWGNAYEAFRTRARSTGPVRAPDVRFAVAAAHVGDTATAAATLARLTALPQTDSIYKVERAAILLALGRKDEALEALRSALPSIAPAYTIHTNSLFLALRGDARFEALIAPRQ